MKEVISRRRQHKKLIKEQSEIGYNTALLSYNRALETAYLSKDKKLDFACLGGFKIQLKDLFMINAKNIPVKDEYKQQAQRQ